VNHGGPFEGDGVFRPRIGRRSRRDRDLVPSFNIRLSRTVRIPANVITQIGGS
jgi:hypothetical protein